MTVSDNSHPCLCGLNITVMLSLTGCLQCPLHYITYNMIVFWRLLATDWTVTLLWSELAMWLCSAMYCVELMSTWSINKNACIEYELLISAPTEESLLSTTDSVCLSRCLSVTLLQIVSSFLFLYGIEPFFGRQFSVWHSTKRCLRFWICCHGNQIWVIFAKKTKLLPFLFLMESSHFSGR